MPIARSIVLNTWHKCGALTLAAGSVVYLSVFSTVLPKLAICLIALASAAALCICLSAESRNKATLRYAFGIVLVCLPVLNNKANFAEIHTALTRFSPVMLLLIGIAHFRHSVTRSGLAGIISAQLVKPGAGIFNSLRVTLLSVLLTVLSGQGSIAVVCTSLNKSVRNPLAVPRITNRALVSTMFVLPTTIASASVASAIPHLDASAVALFGLPLAAVALLGAMAPRLDVAGSATGSAGHRNRRPYGLAAFFVLCCGIMFYVVKQMTLAFAFSMAASYVFEVVVISKRNLLTAFKDESAKSIDAVVPELGLLAASGLLIFTIERIDLLSSMPHQVMQLVSNTYSVFAILIVLLPLITIMGVHPLILFGALFPIMNPVAFEHTHLRYLAWTTMFVMANLLSPVAISAVIAATSIQATTRQTSYAAHWKFCAMLMLVAFAYLSFLAR